MLREMRWVKGYIIHDQILLRIIQYTIEEAIVADSLTLLIRVLSEGYWSYPGRSSQQQVWNEYMTKDE